MGAGGLGRMGGWLRGGVRGVGDGGLGFWREAGVEEVLFGVLVF